MPATRVAAAALAIALASSSTSACSSDEASSAEDSMVVTAGVPFPSDRCELNRAAGPIVYLSGFDFAASASIVDVLVAEQKGYFDELCLDVDVRAGFSAANYPLIADGSAQFASAGSFNELVRYRADQPSADLVALVVEGKSAIDTLIVKPGGASVLADLEGSKIGVKGAITPSIEAMFAKAGLVDGVNYQTIPIDGFDPTEHIGLTTIDGFLGYQSNEPGILDRAGIGYVQFNPSDDDIPGSFGIIYSTNTFVSEHPTAAEDFVRAAMLGLADAIRDPSAASMIALDFIDNNANLSGLSLDGETFRWETESKLVADGTPEGQPVGLPDGDELKSELEAYANIGLFGGTAPDITDAYDADLLLAIYSADGAVIWPTG